jgi:hypothetical protein
MNKKRIEHPAHSPDGWIGSPEAASILSKRHERDISEAYVRRLANMGKITAKEGHGRAKLYWQKDVETCEIKKQGDGSVRRAVRGKKG